MSMSQRRFASTFFRIAQRGGRIPPGGLAAVALGFSSTVSTDARERGDAAVGSGDSGNHSQGYWKLRWAVYCIPKSSAFPATKTTHKVRWDCCGEDSYGVAENEWQSVLAVADGVGGWRSKGVDPSAFSRSLMHHLEAVVRDEPAASGKGSGSGGGGGGGIFSKLFGRAGPQSATPSSGPIEASVLLKRAFWRMIGAFYAGREEPFGSSTACIVSVSKAEGRLDAANLGDSGFILVRKGTATADSGGEQIILRSVSQQHRFNAPYQATLTPEGNVMDTTASAALQGCALQPGDLLVLATDGLWDNLFEEDILSIIRDHRLLPGGAEQRIAETLAVQARRLGERDDYESPFCVEGARHGLFRRGGKLDDVTVIVASVEYVAGNDETPAEKRNTT